VDGRGGERDGDAGRDLQQVAAEERRVVRRAARHEHDEADAAAPEEAPERLDLRALLAHGARQRLGLLRDLLKHQ
jgi:hypothetical protein